MMTMIHTKNALREIDETIASISGQSIVDAGAIVDALLDVRAHVSAAIASEEIEHAEHEALLVLRDELAAAASA